MSTLLEQLGRDTLPKPLLQEFTRWCVWEQAQPALITVLEQATLFDTADNVRAANTVQDLKRVAEEIFEYAKMMRGKTGPMGLSAVEASSFEFSNMTRAVDEEDSEEVAFFAARVCGWSGWASTSFTDPSRKAAREKEARNDQEKKLRQLWVQMSSGD